ncbi:MAG: hypothetical protein ABIG89_04655 [Candidatus Woesearchaeota archaeon]
MTKTWDKFGLKWALESYDQRFGIGHNAYRASAILALLIEPVVDGDIVMDAGSGTGISTVAIYDSCPGDIELICVEPAEAIRVAMHKFGHETLFDSTDSEHTDFEQIRKQLGIGGMELSETYLQLLRETRVRMAVHTKKTSFFNVPAQEISDLVDSGQIEAGSVDKIYCFSSFHWLANNEESGITSAEYVADSLKGFFKALRPGGVLVFNESGLQYDFGDDCVEAEGRQYVGMPINNIHMLQQEFHKRFLCDLNNVFQERGFSDAILINPDGNVDDYHFLFNDGLLRDILNIHDFRFKRLEPMFRYDSPESGQECISYVSKEGKYLLTIMPKKSDDWERFIVTGGNMRYFNHAYELRKVPSEKRWDILKEAYSRTVDKYGSLMSVPFGETFATFVAERV